MSALQVRSTTHMTAPQMLSPEAAPTQNMLAGSTSTWQVKNAPSLLSCCLLCGPFPDCSWVHKASPSEVRRRLHSPSAHGWAGWQVGQMRNRPAPSHSQQRSQRSSRFPPGTHRLLSFTGRFLFHTPAPTPLPPWKAHSCLHPNPKLSYSLYGLRL